MAWKPVAIVGLAVALAAAMIAVLPASPRRTVRVAEAAGSCPITIRVHGSSSPTLPSIAGATRAQFESMWAPGTTVAVLETSSSNGIADLTAGTADVAIATRPLTYAESAGKYAWQVADNVWVATRDTAAVNRIDNSQQVRADDWINFILFNGVIYPPPPPPIPDWDMNLDGNTSIGDLGAVASRWGLTGCYGWIRADGNNSAGVSLGDIGTVTHRWGQQGFICNAWTRCCTQGVVCDWTTMLRDRSGGYELQGAACTELPNKGDPVTLVIRSRVAVDEHLDHHGLHDDINNNAAENAAAVFVSNRTYFRDDGYCAASEILRGQPSGSYVCGWIPFTNIPNAWCLQNRLHVRGHTQTFLDSQYADLKVTPLTPHYDTAIAAGVGTCGDTVAGIVYNQHVILANQDGRGVSGFTAARDDVVAAWVGGGGHFVLAIEPWGNVNTRHQCNGDNPQADGRVVTLAACTDFPGRC